MIRGAWFGLVTGVASILFSSISIAGGWFQAKTSFHDRVQRTWARTLLAAAGVRVEAAGAERLAGQGPLILVANHQSSFDIFALFAALPVSIRFVAKRELERLPCFGRAMRAAGHVFIDRADRKSAAREMHAAAARLRRDGLCLGLFPEGTRSREGSLGPFKKGSFGLAIKTGLPVVPVAVDGGWRLHRGRRLRPGTIRIRVGETIPTRELTVADRDRLLRAVREQIVRLLAGAREEAEPPETTGGRA
ncbi:MAG: lysophospholipid acyltransferase family protein [Gemmatimonadota bacterium]|nr:lysophospholipid acyltransferase family protein [Gemmatimonadota bacterium]